MGAAASIAAVLGAPLGPVGSVIGGLLGSAGEAISGWWTKKQQLKELEFQSTMAVKQAKANLMVDLLKNKQVADFAWENTALQQSGWKDEYWTIILSAPLILGFFPGGADIVTLGFESFNAAPLWYQTALGAAVSVGLGTKGLSAVISYGKGLSADKLQDLLSGLPTQELLKSTESEVKEEEN